jgi:hypothetical protein
MAEIFSAVAAGVALTTELSRLCWSLQKLVIHIRNAPWELSNLADEMGLFMDIYSEFYRACSYDTVRKSNIRSLIIHLVA